MRSRAALALALPASEARPFILAGTYAVIVFSVIVQTLTLPRLMKRYAGRPETQIVPEGTEQEMAKRVGRLIRHHMRSRCYDNRETAGWRTGNHRTIAALGGTTDVTPRGYMKAKDDPEKDRDAHGENLRDPRRKTVADAGKTRKDSAKRSDTD